MTTIYENDYMRLDHVEEHKVLELIWKPATESMSDSDFKAALYLFACWAIEYKVNYLLVRIHDFQFANAMSEELTEWRDRQIFPRYNKAGVLKFAFLGNADQLPPSDPPQSPHANFPTRFFSEMETLKEWFMQ